MEHTQRAESVSIGLLSELAGVPVRTIRFYCDEGVLETRRTGGGHRVFDRSAVDRLLLVRRLRALGLKLSAIVDVLNGAEALEDVVAAELAVVDIELDALAWRRARLRAVEAAAPAERAARLQLLAAVQDGRAARDSIVNAWRWILTPIPSELFDGFIEMNVPELTSDPTPAQVVAYAELCTLVKDPALKAAAIQQIWRSRRDLIRDRAGLIAGVAEACELAGPLAFEHQVSPRPGLALDRFVDAHATSRGLRDTPAFRASLLAGAVDKDRRVQRYWQLTSEIMNTRVVVGFSASWLFDALNRSVGQADTSAPV